MKRQNPISHESSVLLFRLQGKNDAPELLAPISLHIYDWKQKIEKLLLQSVTTLLHFISDNANRILMNVKQKLSQLSDRRYTFNPTMIKNQTIITIRLRIDARNQSQTICKKIAELYFRLYSITLPINITDGSDIMYYECVLLTPANPLLLLWFRNTNRINWVLSVYLSMLNQIISFSQI